MASKKPKKNDKGTPLPPKGASRRKFLALAGGSITLATLAYLGINVRGNSDRFDFLLDKYRHLPELDAPEVRKNLVPVGEVIGNILDYETNNILDEFEPLAKIASAAKGHRGNVILELNTQIYALPVKEQAENVQRYTREALEHLASRINGLTHPSLEVKIVSTGQNYTNTNNEILIAQGFYELFHVRVISEKDEKLIDTLYGTRSDNGAQSHFLRDTNTKKLRRFFETIPTNKIALMAPFSETIPYTRSQKFVFSSEEISLKESQTGEALDEGLSYTLAGEMVDKYKIPNGHKVLDDLVKNASRMQQYAMLEKSIAWIKKNSPQAALDLYMESPEKYIKAIGAA